MSLQNRDKIALAGENRHTYMEVYYCFHGQSITVYVHDGDASQTHLQKHVKELFDMNNRAKDTFPREREIL